MENEILFLLKKLERVIKYASVSVSCFVLIICVLLYSLCISGCATGVYRVNGSTIWYNRIGNSDIFGIKFIDPAGNVIQIDRAISNHDKSVDAIQGLVDMVRKYQTGGL